MLLSFAFFYIWKITKAEILRECVSSVAGDIVEHWRATEDFSRNSENWYVLTDDEAKSVLSNEMINFDGCRNLTSKPQDMKDKNLKIAFKGSKIMVWSRGFDNISGTEDDILMPYGEKVPE
ncbi:hypothetical protein BH10ACI1_BH10ACI1_14210 [soil metagenome]